MRVSEVKFTKRYNVGNYEHEEYSLNAILEEDENHVEAMSQLKADVIAAYTEEKSTVKKAAKKKAAPAAEVEEETEETEVEEETEETEVEETTAKKAKGKGKKTFKKKAQVYQRSNETHKELFSGALRSVAPDWKKTTQSKAKAKDASMKLEGTDFLDEDGSVLDTFKAELKKVMSKK